MPKKNFNKVPSTILAKLADFSQDDVVVACAKRLRPEDIVRYAHLGLGIIGGKLATPAPALPNPGAGRYSRANVEGREKVRHDLPMVYKDFSFDVPNFGDWSKGSHEVVQTREVYQREFYPPKQVELSVSLLGEGQGYHIVKFAIDQVLNRHTDNFERELLYNLNILQENVGSADVFPSAASLAEYAATVSVDWQILPPGKVDDVIQRMLHGKQAVSPSQEKTMRARIEVLAKLHPKAYVTGTDRFVRYFGAQFADNLIVFENVQYGNAIYVMHDEWAELSKRSRIDLLRGDRTNFERIEHRLGWEDKLNRTLIQYGWAIEE